MKAETKIRKNIMDTYGAHIDFPDNNSYELFCFAVDSSITEGVKLGYCDGYHDALYLKNPKYILSKGD